MSVTSMFIRARDRNIFFRLLKMTFTINDLKSNESSSILMKQDMSMSLSITTLFDKSRSFFEFAAISCIWADSRQLHALCFNFLHLKQSSFLNNFFLAESTFNILSFFHAENETEIAIMIVIKMLVIERATWIIDVLRADQAFSFVNQTSACMQMLMNLFKSMIHSLSVAC